MKAIKSSILNCFKPKEDEEKKGFDLIFVDIYDTYKCSTIRCIKRNMNDEEHFKYIAISYRRGDQNEQLVKTSDYTALITSFYLGDFELLCNYIRSEPDLKKIRYVWIDAISVDQQNHNKKKDTILNMNQIYKRATYILAVPDLHRGYLRKNLLNEQVLGLINKYKETIYEEIYHHHHHRQQQHPSIENRIKENEDEDEIKKVYQFLAYLIDDWYNRVWVISECQIAKEKYKQYGTPLKYTFVSLSQVGKPFFSYHFDDDNDQQQQQHLTNNSNSDKSNKILNYENVDDPKTFNQFLRTRFMQRSYLDMILNSNASRNEDRFNVILPLWDKYKHIIKNKNTISEWNITDMTSVRLKLYGIMDDDDLWDKARLLYTCSQLIFMDIHLPSFASHHSMDSLELIEKGSNSNNMDAAYELYEWGLLIYIQDEEEKDRIKQFIINEYKMKLKRIWIENLISIQLDHYHCSYLSVKSNVYFIKEAEWRFKDNLLRYNPFLVEYGDFFHYVYIPFFTFTLLDYTNVPPPGSGIYLFGNIDNNKWVLYRNYMGYGFKAEDFRSNDYAFNIY